MPPVQAPHSSARGPPMRHRSASWFITDHSKNSRRSARTRVSTNYITRTHRLAANSSTEWQQRDRRSRTTLFRRRCPCRSPSSWTVLGVATREAVGAPVAVLLDMEHLVGQQVSDSAHGSVAVVTGQDDGHKRTVQALELNCAGRRRLSTSSPPGANPSNAV